MLLKFCLKNNFKALESIQKQEILERIWPLKALEWNEFLYKHRLYSQRHPLLLMLQRWELKFEMSEEGSGLATEQPLREAARTAGTLKSAYAQGRFQGAEWKRIGKQKEIPQMATSTHHGEDRVWSMSLPSQKSLVNTSGFP